MKKQEAHRPFFSLPLRSLLPALLGLFVLCFTTACQTTGSNRASSGQGGVPKINENHPAVKNQYAQIAQEPRGDYYIGRRWWTEGTRFWGYLRRPGEPWKNSKLVIMNEGSKLQPDRLPEQGMGQKHGFDHNHEYKIWGSFTGQTVYDPNSNFIIPEFRLSGYELISPNPGFLFMPGEGYSPNRLPPKHPPVFN